MTLGRQLILGMALMICTILCPAVYAEETGTQRIEIRRSDIRDIWEVKKEIRAYRDSGKWDRDIETVIGQARAHLGEYDARRGKYAIVLDIDETSISNYSLIEQMDFAFESKLVEPGWEKWIKEAAAPAITPTLELFREAKKKGFQVFFITGRPEGDREGTEKLLQKTGYKGYDGLFMRTAEELRHSVAIFKTGQRKRLTQEGCVIVLNVGDQESDMAGGYSLFMVKIPNPMYCIP
jgi:hypothetical protein